MEEYIYESLNLDRPAIRLLRLRRGDDDSEISCSLFQAELNRRYDAASYEALSYTWGSPALTRRIIVDDRCLNVTCNLHSALQQLRYQGKDRILWIDAICIDQKDMKERGHQVEQMSKIYSEAESVIFWLGPGTVETDMAMESLQYLQRESLDHSALDWSFQDDRWTNLWTLTALAAELSHKDSMPLLRQGLRELLARPWFRRVWILQEVALAKAGIIICGSKSVSAELFAIFPVFLEIEPDTHCQSVLDIMPSPWSWRKASWWGKSPGLRALLVHFGDSEASESRDLVYALRGMASDATGKNGIIPDYDKPEEDLVREVVRLVEHCELEELASETPPRTVRDLIKCLRALSLDHCMDLARRSLPHDMEMHLKKSKIRVSQQMIVTAAEYDKTGEVIEVLLRYRPKGVMVNDRVWVAAAKDATGPKGIFKALFSHSHRIKTSEEVLMAAVRNESCGDEIFEALVSHQKHHIKITDEVLIAAAENKECGGKIFNTLFFFPKHNYEISYKVLMAAVRNESCGGEIFKALSHHQDQIKVPDELLMATVRKKSCSSEIFEALFHHSHRIKTSDELFMAAVRNKSCGSEIFEALLYIRRNRIKITDAMLLAAAENKGCGNKIFNILFRNQQLNVEISYKVLTAAAMNEQYGNRILEAFFCYTSNLSDEMVEAAARNAKHGILSSELSFSLLRHQGESESRGLLEIAAANEACGDELIHFLLSHNPIPEFISAEAIIAAAKNKQYGYKVIDTFLSYNPSPNIISAEAITAAVENYSYGNNIINILLSYNPSPHIISAEAIIATAKNNGYGKEVMDILLSYDYFPYIITAAAMDMEYGDKVINILSFSNPSLASTLKQGVIVTTRTNRRSRRVFKNLGSYGKMS